MRVRESAQGKPLREFNHDREHAFAVWGLSAGGYTSGPTARRIHGPSVPAGKDFSRWNIEARRTLAVQDSPESIRLDQYRSEVTFYALLDLVVVFRSKTSP